MKSIAVYSGLLAAALVGSYLTWTAGEEGAKSSDDANTLVYRAAEGSVSRLGWTSDKLSVSVSQQSDDNGEFLWVEVTERVEVKPNKTEDPPEEEEPASEEPAEEPADGAGEEEGEASAEAEPEPEPEPEYEEKTYAFKGGTAAEELWSNFAPLYAKRELQGVDPKAEPAFGFEEPEGTLVVERSDGSSELVVGAETYGRQGRYALLGDRLFLLEDKTIAPLRHAKRRLEERRLHPFDKKDVQAVAVQLPSGEAAEFVQKNATDPAKASWTRTSDPQATDESAATWADKLFRVSATGYVDQAELEGLPEPQLAVIVSDGKQKWSIEVLKAGGDYFAKSSFARGLVKLTRTQAADLVADAPALVGTAE